MHRQFEASQRVLEQFFEYSKTLGLEKQLRLEDSPVPSRTSLPTSSPRRSPSCCQASSPPSPLQELPFSPSSLCGKVLSSPAAPSPSQEQGTGSDLARGVASLLDVHHGDAPLLPLLDVHHGDAPLLPDGAGDAHEEPAPQESQQEAATDDPAGALSQQALRVSAQTRTCPHCQERVKLHNFKRHLMVHEDQVPQESCNLCGLKVKRCDSMKRHLKRCPR